MRGPHDRLPSDAGFAMSRWTTGAWRLAGVMCRCGVPWDLARQCDKKVPERGLLQPCLAQNIHARCCMSLFGSSTASQVVGSHPHSQKGRLHSRRAAVDFLCSDMRPPLSCRQKSVAVSGWGPRTTAARRPRRWLARRRRPRRGQPSEGRDAGAGSTAVWPPQRTGAAATADRFCPSQPADGVTRNQHASSADIQELSAGCHMRASTLPSHGLTTVGVAARTTGCIAARLQASQ